MANDIPIGGLQLEFTENGGSNVVDTIKELATALQAIKDASKGGNLTARAKQIDSLAESIDKIKISSVNNMRELANSITDIATVSIPATLATSLGALSTATDKVDVGKIEDIKQAVEDLGSTATPDVSVGVDKAKTEVSGLADEITDSMDKAKESVEGLADATTQISTKLIDDSAVEEINETREAFDKASNSASSVATSTKNMNKSIKASRTELQFFGNTKLTSIKEAFNNIKARIDSARESMAELNKKVASVATSSVVTGLKNVKSAFVKMGSAILGANSFAGKLLKSFVRIAFYRSIRFTLSSIVKGFKQGADNLYLWSDAFDKTRTFANSMDRIATAILYVKNSLGAMISPIINAVAPALDYLADKFVSLLNIVNEFLSAFTGASTYTVAKKIPTQFKEITDSAKDATKAIKSFTIGIDELNIIEDTGSAGGGIGGDNKVAEDWFEKQEVSNDMKDFADKVHEYTDLVRGYIEYMFSPVAWEDLKNSLVELGSYLPSWEEGFEYWKGEAENLTGKVGDWGADGIEGLIWGFQRIKDKYDALIDAFKKDPIKTTLDISVTLITTLSGISAHLLIIKQSVKNLKEWIKDPASQFEKIGDVIVKVFPFVSAINALLQSHKNYAESFTKVKNAWEWIYKQSVGIVSFYSGLVVYVTAWKNALDGVKKVIKAIKKLLNGVWTVIGKIALGDTSDLWSSLISGTGRNSSLTALLDKNAEEQGTNYTDKFFEFATGRIARGLTVWGNAFTAVQNDIMNKVHAKSAQNGGKMTDSFRTGALNKQGALNGAMNTLAKGASNAFASSDNIANFKKGGQAVVTGIQSGLDNKSGALYKDMKKMGEKMYEEFKRGIQSHSPSKLFAQGGENIVLGVNKGIIDNEDSTATVIANWVKSFSDIKSTFDVSNLALPDVSKLAGTVSGAINANSNITTQATTGELADFLTDTLMPVITQISADAKRQADKEETVTIDGRKLTSSVNRQNKKNGFSFTS